MFFQTRAATVGRTKKGEITNRRTMPCPKNGWSSSNANRMPPTMVISSTPRMMLRVLTSAVAKAGSVRKK
jgi:hypothetical protein